MNTYDHENTTTMTLAQERFLRETLVPALRSGRYEQGQGALHILDETTDRHYMCCLGVACDLIAPDAWHTTFEDDGGNLRRAMDDIVLTAGIPYSDDPNVTHSLEAFWWVVDDVPEQANAPQALQQMVGIDVGGSIVLLDKAAPLPDDAPDALRDYQSLIEMNDGGYTFDDIADVIEWVLDHPDIARFAQEADVMPGPPESALSATN